MASQAPFGNDASKIDRYRAFWDRSDVDRPLVGFSFKSWFPLQEYAASAAWQSADFSWASLRVGVCFAIAGWPDQG